MEIKIGDRVRLRTQPHPAGRFSLSAVVDRSRWNGREGTVKWISRNEMIEVLLDGDQYTWWWLVAEVEHAT